MTDQSSLLAAITAAPDDDAPRLVYADWLDEHGHSDRAEFIRVQVESATLEEEDSASQAVFAFLRRHNPNVFREFDWEPVDPGVARRVELRARAAALVKRHGRAWKAAEAPRRCGVTWADMDRGFFAAGTLRGIGSLTRSAGDLLQRVPLCRLRAHGLTPAQAHALAESGILARLTALEISGPAESIRILGASPDTAHIRELFYGYGNDANGGAWALAASNHWRGLRSLDLRSVGPLTTEAAEELFRAPHLRGLTRLRVWGPRWPARTVRTLTEGGFNRLRTLQLFQCDLTDEAAEVLADSPSLRRLRSLELQTNRITGAGLSALLASPYLKNLTVLDLSQNSVRRFDPGGLEKARAASLRVLDLQSSLKPGADVGALAGCPAVRGLIWLNLGSNRLTDRAVQGLCQATGWSRLAVLNLLYCRIGDGGVAALADWPGLAGVRCLHLNGNDFGPAGAAALAASPHLTDVRHLCVERQEVRAAGLAALRKRFGRAAQAK
jgi:uncharacterized protein (TIGR02996 family)